jgi:hypothetical protein
MKTKNDSQSKTTLHTRTWQEDERLALSTILHDPSLIEKVDLLCPVRLNVDHFFHRPAAALFAAIKNFGGVVAQEVLVKHMHQTDWVSRADAEDTVRLVHATVPFCKAHAVTSLTWFVTEREFYRKVAQGFSILEEQRLTRHDSVEYLVRALDLPPFQDCTDFQRIVGAVLRTTITASRDMAPAIDDEVVRLVTQKWIDCLLMGEMTPILFEEDRMGCYLVSDIVPVLERLANAGRVKIRRFEQVEVARAGTKQIFLSVVPTSAAILSLIPAD